MPNKTMPDQEKGGSPPTGGEEKTTAHKDDKALTARALSLFGSGIPEEEVLYSLQNEFPEFSEEKIRKIVDKILNPPQEAESTSINAVIKEVDKERENRIYGKAKSADMKIVSFFVDAYSNLEEAIIKDASIPTEQKQELLYSLLEIDIDALLKDLKDSKAKTAEEIKKHLQTYQKQYESRLAALPQEIQKKAKTYIDHFVKFFAYKQNRLTNWQDPEATYFGAGSDLTEVTQGDKLDSGLIAFAFFENSNAEVKDIFMRYKLKSYLEKQHGRDNKKIMDVLHGTPIVDLSQKEVEDFILTDLKKFYTKQARFQIGGDERSPHALGQIINRLDTVIGYRNFSIGSMSFLGGTYQPKDEKDASGALSKQFRVVSTHKYEVPTAALSEKGVTNVVQKLESPKHVSMEKLMIDFSKRMKALADVGRRSKELMKAFSEGNAEGFQGAASVLTNDMFDTLAQESQMILTFIPTYYNRWLLNFNRGDGQLRPSVYGTSSEGSVALEDLYFKRAWKAVHPNAQEDEIVLYQEIAKMMMLGTGDFVAEVSRLLPPINLSVPGLDKKLEGLADEVRTVRRNPPEGKTSSEAVADVVFEFVANENPELKLNFYDAFSRALLMKLNPILHLYLWIDLAHEHRINELLFAGGYNTIEEEVASGGSSFLQKLKRSLGAIDTITSPKEMLALINEEKSSLSLGMTDAVLKQRQKGKVPLSIRLPNLIGSTGAVERGSWRLDIFDHSAFLSWFLDQPVGPNNEKRRETLKQGKFSTADIKQLIDCAFQIGPEFAYLLHKKFDKDEEFSKFLTDEDKKKLSQLKQYILNKTYEYFPAVFIARSDLRRFTHRRDKMFQTEWQRNIYKILLQEKAQGKKELSQLFSPNAQVYSTASTPEWAEISETYTKAREIQFILLEAVMSMEEYLIKVRNEQGMNTDNALSMRKLLSILQEDIGLTDPAKRSKHYESVHQFFKNLKQHYTLEGDTDTMIKVFVNNVFTNFYGDSTEGITSFDNGAVKRGIVDGLSYYNIGAIKEADKKKRVDLLTFIDTLANSPDDLTGPVFNLYKENLNVKEFVVFSPEYVGAKSSGKSLVKRLMEDLGTNYTKGMDAISEALRVIPKGVMATTAKDYDAAENEFIEAVLKAGKAYESYIGPESRQKLGVHLAMQWIMMALLPGNPVRFNPISALRQTNIFEGGKSLAQLAQPREGLSQPPSNMKMDYIRLRNFIYKCQNKGILPISVKGHELSVKPAKKVKDVFAAPIFEKFDKKIAEFEERIQNKDEKEQLSLRERMAHNLFKAGQSFGSWGLFDFKIFRDPKHKWNAQRMFNMFGITRFKDGQQFYMYATLALLAVLVLAAEQGMGELNIK